MKKIPKKLYIVFECLVLVLCFFYALYFILKSRSISRIAEPQEYLKQNGNIICASIFDSDESEAFFKGVQEYCNKQNAHVTFFSPDLNGYKSNISDWISYANYVDADGIILYGFDETIFIKELFAGKKLIPCVVAGNMNVAVDSQNVSTVQLDSYKISKLFFECVSKNVSGQNNFQLAAFVHGERDKIDSERLLYELKQSKFDIKQIQILSKDSPYDEIRQNVADLVRNQNTKIFICLTEEDTYFVCRSLVDLNLTERAQVYGIGNSERNMDYFKKGVLASLIYCDEKFLGNKSGELIFKTIDEENSFSYTFSAFSVLE